MEFSSKRPFLIDKYLEGKEVEVDAIVDGEQVLIPGIMQHIERAGVHSGDSMAVYPALDLTVRETEAIVDYTTRIGLALGVQGLMNVQYVIFQREVFVLEVNPRASRTVPFLSKVTGVPMVKVATRVMLGQSLAEQGYSGRAVARAAAGGREGAGLLHEQALHGGHLPGTGDEVHRRGDGGGHRPSPPPW